MPVRIQYCCGLTCLEEPPQQPQSSGFASWFAPSSWFGMGAAKEEEQLTEHQKKLEELSKATIKQCKLEGLVQSSWYVWRLSAFHSTFLTLCSNISVESFLCLVKVLVTAATPTPQTPSSPSQGQNQGATAGGQTGGPVPGTTFIILADGVLQEVKTKVLIFLVCLP